MTPTDRPTEFKDKETLREALEKIAMSDRFLGELQEPKAAAIARTALASLTPSGEKEGE